MRKFVVIFNLIAVIGTLVFFYGVAIFNLTNMMILSSVIGGYFLVKKVLEKIKNLNNSLDQVTNISEIYKSVIYAIDDYWVIFDENFFSKGISDNMADLLGVSGADVSLSRFLNIFKDSLKFDEFNNQLSDLKTFGKELNIKIRNSSKVFQVKARKFSINSEISYIFVMQDITEISTENSELDARVRGQENLLSLLTKILDTLPIPVWARNPDTNLIYCNSFYLDMVGETKEKVINDNIPLVKGELFGGGNSLAKNVQKTGTAQEISHNINVHGERCTFSFVEVPMYDNIV